MTRTSCQSTPNSLAQSVKVRETSANPSGLRESVETFRESVEGATAKDVMVLVLMTQYFDTLKEVGAQARSNTILMPHSPGAMPEFFQQIQNAIMVGQSGTQQASAASAGSKS